MQYRGIIMHHSACSSINGKGYDYFITRSGDLIPAFGQTDPNYVHICVEGDYSDPQGAADAALKEQLFVLNKLVLRLLQAYSLERSDIYPHNRVCPGPHFPWSQLVISSEDRYH